VLAEQFLAPGYGTNGVEGLASGLPVLANLEHEAYSRVYRRFGFLNECPIVSAAPENLAERLRVLVRNPELRRELGTASRAFAEKYHSYATAQYMFGALYEKLVRGADIDLMTLFHPLLSEYNRRTPRVQHPLIENRLTSEWLSRV
jgi:glycosyltransferase involved in cell wall biosynthesis